MQLSSPIRLPGTRLARENHGGRAGRIWKHDRIELEGIALNMPRWCPRCDAIYIYDQRGHPHCPICGDIQDRETEKEPEERKKYRSMKEAKRARIIQRSGEGLR